MESKSSVQSAQNEHHQYQLNVQRQAHAARDATILLELRQLAMPSSRIVQIPHTHVAPSKSPQTMPCSPAGFVIDPEAAEEDIREVRSVRRYARTNKQRQTFASLRVSFAAWLTGRVWDIAVVRSQNGLTFNVQQWNVIPRDSIVFEHCSYGDVYAIRDMLVTGKASVFDVDPFGGTLLDVSICAIQAGDMLTALPLSTLQCRAIQIYVVSCLPRRGFR